jgi:hypothetical protein
MVSPAPNMDTTPSSMAAEKPPVVMSPMSSASRFSTSTRRFQVAQKLGDAAPTCVARERDRERGESSYKLNSTAHVPHELTSLVSGVDRQRAPFFKPVHSGRP